jgi:hypothetical protein
LCGFAQRTDSNRKLQPQKMVTLVLVGSQATGKTHATSDWDIALQWSPQLYWLTAPRQPGHACQRRVPWVSHSH